MDRRNSENNDDKFETPQRARKGSHGDDLSTAPTMGKTEKKDVGLTKYSDTIKEEKSRDYALTLTLTLTLSEKEIGGEEVLYSAKRKIRNKKGSEDLELEENSDGRWAIGQALKHQDLGTGNSYEVSYDPAYVVSGIPIASILKTSNFLKFLKQKALITKISHHLTGVLRKR